MNMVKSYKYPQAIGKVIALKQFYIGFQMLSKDQRYLLSFLKE